MGVVFLCFLELLSVRRSGERGGGERSGVQKPDFGGTQISVRSRRPKLHAVQPPPEKDSVKPKRFFVGHFFVFFVFFVCKI